MPYIAQARRPGIQQQAETLAMLCTNEGEMNFAITCFVHAELKRLGLRYTNLNMLVGVLESVKVEFNRAVVAPYENRKIEENGDIGILEE